MAISSRKSIDLLSYLTEFVAKTEKESKPIGIGQGHRGSESIDMEVRYGIYITLPDKRKRRVCF